MNSEVHWDPGEDTARTHIPYRPDIDGLRAIAVLLVVLTHLGTPISGGFIGVDVFFVISGYLISASILADFRRGVFSFASFYERRIRRIAPALIVVLLAVSGMVYLSFTPDDIRAYGGTLLAAVFSVSNVVFWSQAGYFDASSYVKPLLHTWSLAVEEQFYLLFPLFILLLWKGRKANLRWVIVGTALVSLVASIVCLRAAPASVFYLLPFRTWELLVGTIISQDYLPKPRTALARNAASSLGLGLICVAAIAYTSDTSFPGLAAVPPVLGAALIILAGEEGSSFVGRLLSIRPATFIGQISYSLYLWHWPLIVFQHTNRLFFLPSHMTHPLVKPRLFALSLVVATLSWACVEQPFRRGQLRPGRRRLFQVVGWGTVAALAITVSIFATRGFRSRFQPEANSVAEFQTGYIDPEWDEGHCFLQKDQNPKDFHTCVAAPGRSPTLMIGDSHAADLWPGLRLAFPADTLRELTVSDCRPLLSSRNSRLERCARVSRFLFEDYLPAHPVGTVLLSARWSAAELPELERTIAWIKGHGMRPVVIGPGPEFDVPLPHLLALEIQRRNSRYPVDLSSYQVEEFASLDKRMAELAASSWHVDYISIFATFCKTGCPVWVGDNVPLLFDEQHLTPEAARKIVQNWRVAGLLESTPFESTRAGYPARVRSTE